MRALAAFLAFALVHVSFGSQAWAQVIGAVNAPVGGSAVAPVHPFSSPVTPVNAVSASLSNAGPAGSFLAASLPPAAFPHPSAVSAAASAAVTPGALVARPSAVAAVPGKVSETGPVTLQAGPRTGRIAGKTAAVIAGVRAFFGGKTVENVPAAEGAVALDAPLSAAHALGLTPTADDGALDARSDGGKNEPPVPPTAPDAGGANKGWFGLGRAAVFFIGALVVGQIGVEALGSAMPALVQKTFGDFTVVAQLGIFFSIASIIGRQLGPLAVTKWGLRKTYLLGTATRIVSISALCFLLATGHMTLPLMMAFYCMNGLIGGVTMTAETSIPPALMGSNQAKIEKFWTWEQTLLEIIGVAGPIVTGAVVTSMGFLPALLAFPAAFAIALAILFFTLRIPQKVEAMRLADLKNKKNDPQGVNGVRGAFGQFFHRVAAGAKLVWRNPLLRTSFLAYTVYMMLNPFLYSMIAPAYGILLVGADHMASVYGLLTGLYSFGGLLGGFLMIREQKKLHEAKKKGMSDAEESEALRRSMLKWMKWGAAGLLSILTLAVPISPLGALLHLPGFLSWAGALTLPAVALIPFGVAQVIATVKLRSYFQAKVPEGRMPEAMGFFGSASLAVSTLGLLALKYLFKNVGGSTPFMIIAALMIPLGVYYLYLTRGLSKVSAPPAGN